MKRLFQFIFGLVLSVALFSACEGPAGTAGKNAAESCTQCHGNADVNLKFAQYDLSKHGTGTIYEEEAGNLGCDGCHTGDGFAQMVSLGSTAVAPTTAGTSKINCQACHTIHTAYDSTDFKRRVTAGFALRIGGAQVDFKGGNLCATCHQGRSYTRVAGNNDTITPASAGAVYSRFGPHYGVVANVASWNGLEPITGFTATGNPHSSLEQGCVTCHMGKDVTNPASGGHTFKMVNASLAKSDDSTSCKTCHSATPFTSGNVASQVKADLAKIKKFLVDHNYLDLSQATLDPNSYNVLGEYFSMQGSTTVGGKVVKVIRKDTSAVILNYLFLAKDRSNGAHNPANTKAMLSSMKTFLGIQ